VQGTLKITKAGELVDLKYFLLLNPSLLQKDRIHVAKVCFSTFSNWSIIATLYETFGAVKDSLIVTQDNTIFAAGGTVD
jgi:hypothetical protein